jgi:hypothetical protein
MSSIMSHVVVFITATRQVTVGCTLCAKLQNYPHFANLWNSPEGPKFSLLSVYTLKNSITKRARNF